MTTASARVHRRLRCAWAILLAVLIVAIASPDAGAKVNKADVAIQRQAVLRKSDLPAGWKSSPSEDSSPPELPTCAGLRRVDDGLDPLATHSPEFWKSEVTRAENSVVVLASVKEAKGWLAPYREPEATTCLGELVKVAFTDPSIQGVRVYVTPNEDTPRGADDAVGFEVEITATTVPTTQQAAQSIVFIVDVLVARVGRALTNFTFENPSNPLPEQGLLVDAVIGRLQQAGI